ncbi:MAG: endopeptidase La [Nannocystaceae bacterium]|nr:endopeptidase La [Deltaproteobacteria bacterium]MBP7287193.1 endopeptidase La [Nannocystaceae bacterium]
MSSIKYPTEVSLLPLRSGVLLPGSSMSMPVGRRRSVALVERLEPGAIVGVAIQRDPDVDDPGRIDLHDIGTYARVVKVQRVREGNTYRVLLEGLARFHIDELLQSEPYLRARVETRADVVVDETLVDVLAEELRTHMKALAAAANPQLIEIIDAAKDPGLLADRVVAGLDVDRTREIEMLHTVDVAARLRLCATLIAEARARFELKQKIGDEVRRELGKDQREAMLRQQLRAIQKELGDDGDGTSDNDLLRKKLADANLPEEAQKLVDREFKRLESLNPAAPDAQVTRNYLEWIADLPWDKRADTSLDIDAVAAKLDADHFGLEKVKQRILEHLAVLKLSGNTRGTILCLAGPPGVGKTSLGQSIADATGRPFIRVALGGVRDEAEIRGHRRTYVGALPGRLISALRKVKVKNPVILLDEVDKLTQGWMGSPEAALLELLDPEQNKSFTDHYLELPFDMSEVMFIATANSLEPLSAPLRDRLEIIELSGYTAEEKRHIARGHLVPRKLAEHALDEESLTITDDALDAIVRDYTREAGVRQLTREITKLCRALALQSVRGHAGKTPQLSIDAADLGKYLGKVRFFNEIAERTAVAGVATGLAWTPVGGDILFIETSRMAGKGGLQITGQLGEVMQESAKAALTFVRSNADVLGVDPRVIETHDVHIHVPAGAVPKDGPSAGVTMFTALTSLFTGRKVRSDTAMTGEVTLRGRVLPVGGIKEKVIAAHRAGIKRVILPSKNQRDVDDIPEKVRDELEILFAEDMLEVLQAALEPDASGARVAASGPAAAAV